MKTDLSNVPDIQDYSSVPPGRYPCKLVDVRSRQRDDGKARWSLRWHVSEGEWAGRLAAWDTLAFSEKGLPRVKFVLSRLGFHVDGIVDLEPEDLIGAQAWVTVEHQEYEDPVTGTRRMSGKVPYAGYDRWNGEHRADDDDDGGNGADAVPF